MFSVKDKTQTIKIVVNRNSVKNPHPCLPHKANTVYYQGLLGSDCGIIILPSLLGYKKK